MRKLGRSCLLAGGHPHCKNLKISVEFHFRYRKFLPKIKRDPNWIWKIGLLKISRYRTVEQAPDDSAAQASSGNVKGGNANAAPSAAIAVGASATVAGASGTTAPPAAAATKKRRRSSTVGTAAGSEGLQWLKSKKEESNVEQKQHGDAMKLKIVELGGNFEVRGNMSKHEFYNISGKNIRCPV